MINRRIMVGLLVLVAGAEPRAFGEPRQVLEYAPAPVDNPLKGLVPYQGDVRNRFPHSLEFSYIAYSALVQGYDTFDWQPLEAMLNDIAKRGHQAVFRIYLEYPGKTGAIPEFLIKDGLKVHRWQYPGDRPMPLETPDYENNNLRKSLQQFLVAFGKKYDGDPRVGFITAGLLGLWGEWHTHPKSELFASKKVQTEVLDRYETAFRVTPILLRYPASAKATAQVKNADRPFGYHDDSFAWATLDTGKKGDEWFYMTTLKAAGPDAEAKWKTHPIGGEIRPEAWGKVFDAQPSDRRIQDFRACVEATHASWLLDSGLFAKGQPEERRKRAEAMVRRMGYELHVPAVTTTLTAGKLHVQLEIENRGVAPFYYDWKAEWCLLAAGKPVKTWPAKGSIKGILPNDKPRRWNETLDVSNLNAGRYEVALRVINPLPNGKPLCFANKSQTVDAQGWLVLGSVTIP